MNKILVIEDDQVVRENLVELLELEDFEVYNASNGQIGMELAKAHLPDLIICDVMMPELDGFGVLTALRSSLNTASIPLIFLTAKTSKTDLRQGMSLGADDYITKPFTKNELLQAISVRLEKQAAIDQQQEQKLERLRNSIALSLPHELRSPLNSILGFSQVLIDEFDSLERAEIREISEKIYNSGERLSRLIQNFLLHAELELIATDPKRIEALQASRVSSAVSVIVEVIRDRAKQANRKDDVQLELVDSTVQIAKVRLEKIVEELIDNAFKFSENGTLVRIVGHPLEQTYALSITNSGRGMSAAQIAEVGACRQFERKLYEQQGSGLGLSVVTRLTQLLGGELTIESIPNQQTTVRVVLPI